MIHRDDVTKGRQTDYLSLGGHPVARITKGRLTSGVTWLLANHQGTPEISLDSLGGHIYRDTLTPFGEHYGREHAASRNHAGFTGHVEDYQTGLATAVAFSSYFWSTGPKICPSDNRLRSMQARYYDPALGRFLSNDPVGFADSGFDPAYFNRYAYTANDPVNNIDPDDRLCVPCIGGLVGFGAEAVAIVVDVVGGKNVGAIEGVARLGTSTALGTVGGGAAGQLAKGITRAAARSSAGSAVKATASVTTKTVGNAAIGGVVNGSNTALRREVQVGLNGSSDITKSDVIGDIALGAVGAAVGTLGGEVIEGVARLSGSTNDIGKVGVLGGQTFDAAANVIAANPGVLGGDSQSPVRARSETRCSTADDHC